MTTNEIKSMFERLIDDTVSDDLALDLANTAKDAIETERDWEILLSSDTSNTTTVGNTFETAIALPTDFSNVVDIFVGDYRQLPIPFEHQRRWKDSQARYFIDYKNNNLYLCGTVSTSETIYIYYLYETDALTLTTSPVWPARFHKLIAYKMADIYLSGVDADDLTRQQYVHHKIQADNLYKQMVRYDTELKLNKMGNSTAPQGYGNVYRDDVVDFND